jgi:hypothetical protein
MLMLIAVLSSTGMAFADERTPAPAIGQDVVSDTNDALEIMKDHMRSQLDWRSYFTNRMDARRRANAADQRVRQEPRAASADLQPTEGIDPETGQPGRP